MKQCILTAALLLLISTSALAQKVQFEYRDLYRSQQAMRQVDGARYLRPGLRLVGKGFEDNTQGLVLTIKALQKDLEIRVDPNGNFDLPMSTELQKENPQIWSKLVKSDGSVQVQNTLRVDAPAQQTFNYQLLGQMRDEFRNSRGLMTRFFSPSIRGVLIDFGANGEFAAALSYGNSTRTITSEANGYLRLPLTDELIAQNAQVSLSAMPASIRLEME